MWYNYNNLLSRNCLFNFVIGLRGGGKTYGAKKLAIKNFLNKGDEFIYVKRYKSDLKRIGSFFSDIAHEFPDHALTVKGRTFYCDGEVMGYAVPLSTSGNEKSNSYPKVKWIIFDEFIISSEGNQRYLANEVIAFLEFYETVDRKRDETRAIFIANAVTAVNPYFIYFKIKPDKRKAITGYKNLFAIEMYTNAEFIAEKERTRFGQIITGTEYGDYAIKNEFLEDSEWFLEKRSAASFFEFALVYNSEVYGFWLDPNEGRLYMSKDHDPSSKQIYALTNSDHRPNYYLVKSIRENPALRKVKHAYQYSYLYFENQYIKKAGEDIIKLIY